VICDRALLQAGSKRMRRFGLNALLWSAFGIMILLGAYVALNACDLGLRSLFASNACQARAASGALESERAQEAQLQSRIHAEEIRLALLPACPKPQPLQPEPLPVVKIPDPPLRIEPEPKQAFEVPKKLEDLKGCWQSARGDIDILTDDAQHLPVGKARLCYCFGSNGEGVAQISYSDGAACRARLVARISPDQVFMRHDVISCREHRDYVVHDITCGGHQSDKTTCEIISRGKTYIRRVEQFVRVTDDYCNWDG
jgi:hypothetical protein